MSTWTDAQVLALEVVGITFSCLSFLCDALIIFSFYKFKELRKLAYSFVFYIAVANIMREFARMWGGGLDTNTFGCSLQGFLITYGGLSSFWWIANIAAIMWSMMFVSNFWNVDSQQIERRKLIFIVVNFSFPLLFAVIPLFTNAYGNVGGWCWIQSRNTGDIALRFVSYYGHLILILLFCIFVYVRIWWYLRNALDANKEEENATTKMYARIKWYPLCLILGFGFAAFRRILQTITGDPLPFSFAIIQSITTGSFGILILCFYGRLGKLRKLYTGWWSGEPVDQSQTEQSIKSHSPETMTNTVAETNTADVAENTQTVDV
eukprot:CAMPEP_0197078580 /NCGR_PEP_ID=MMETSP1384-20130603/213192_1 /TAXON_ID=29189 /ORGANISM="Ammonia sp." /LENGTH=320 /DNA_ID=CAMNT_0042517447 /DNA_START=30 /DNA_END=992 /DNA_ORIENTATION=+